jgi:hypothetical protein
LSKERLLALSLRNASNRKEQRDILQEEVKTLESAVDTFKRLAPDVAATIAGRKIVLDALLPGWTGVQQEA